MPQSTLGSLRVIDSLPTVGGLSVSIPPTADVRGVMPMNTLRLLANVADTGNGDDRQMMRV